MEDQQKPTNKIALNYGLYLGIASVLVSVIMYAIGKQHEQDWKTGVLSFLIMVTIIVLGIKKYKEFNGGFMTLGQALKTGIGIALIGGVISIAYTLIFITFIEPDALEQGMEIARQKMLDNPNLSEEQVDAQMEMAKKFSGPGMIAGFGLLWTIFLGFVISLISTIGLQKLCNPISFYMKSSL